MKTSKLRSIVFHLLAVSIVGMAILPLCRTYSEQRKIMEKFKQAQEANNQANSKQIEAKRLAEQLKDPTFLVNVARSDYYYSLPGEIIFELGEDITHDGFNE